jgi:hypothetical protein
MSTLPTLTNIPLTLDISDLPPQQPICGPRILIFSDLKLAYWIRFLAMAKWILTSL